MEEDEAIFGPTGRPLARGIEVRLPASLQLRITPSGTPLQRLTAHILSQLAALLLAILVFIAFASWVSPLLGLLRTRPSVMQGALWMLLLLAEYGSIVFTRTRLTAIALPRLILVTWLLFYAYYDRTPTPFVGVAMAMLLCGWGSLFISLVLAFEVPAYAEGRVSHECPRQVGSVLIAASYGGQGRGAGVARGVLPGWWMPPLWTVIAPANADMRRVETYDQDGEGEGGEGGEEAALPQAPLQPGEQLPGHGHGHGHAQGQGPASGARQRQPPSPSTSPSASPSPLADRRRSASAGSPNGTGVGHAYRPVRSPAGGSNTVVSVGANPRAHPHSPSPSRLRPGGR